VRSLAGFEPARWVSLSNGQQALWRLPRSGLVNATIGSDQILIGFRLVMEEERIK